MVSPTSLGIRSRGTTSGRPATGAVASRRTGATRIGAPDSGRVDDDARPDLQVLSAEGVVDARPDDPATVLDQSVRSGPRRDDRALLAGGPGDRERVPGVVLHAVVEEQPAAELRSAHSRRVGEHLVDGQMAVPATIVPCAEDVVQRHPRLVEDAGHDRPAEERERSGWIVTGGAR
jgi:hypothetical protein